MLKVRFEFEGASCEEIARLIEELSPYLPYKIWYHEGSVYASLEFHSLLGVRRLIEALNSKGLAFRLVGLVKRHDQLANKGIR